MLYSYGVLPLIPTSSRRRCPRGPCTAGHKHRGGTWKWEAANFLELDRQQRDSHINQPTNPPRPPPLIPGKHHSLLARSPERIFTPNPAPESRQNVVRGPDADDYRPQGRFVTPPPQRPLLPLLESRADGVTPLGTDTSQGKGQIVSNINACLAVQGTIKSTLGPYGGDLLMVDENGRQTITNDGATVMKVQLRPE